MIAFNWSCRILYDTKSGIYVMQLDEACRERGIAFLAAASRGTTSYFFSDPGMHGFTPIVLLLFPDLGVIGI